MKLSKPTRDVRILVIDDNVDGANMLAEVLNVLGYSAAAVHDGQVGVAQAAAQAPHIVFLDLGMPNMDGFAVIHALRALPQATGMHIVALTAWDDEKTIARVASCGFDAHLTKPASVDALVETIEHHC